MLEDYIWQDINVLVQNREVIEEAFKNKFDVNQQATYVAELAQTKRRMAELKMAEQRLLVKYADPVQQLR